MIKNITVNGVTKTISNAELHVEEENEKEGVLVFNGEVFGENIEKISRIKIGDKFYTLGGGGSGGGVELFNIAELPVEVYGWDTVNYGTDDGDYYRAYRCRESGYGQMILDAFNAGKKIVYIGKSSSWTNDSCSFCQEAFYVGDLDIFNEGDRKADFQYIVVLFHGIEWNSGSGQMYKPRIHMFKFPK